MLLKISLIICFRNLHDRYAQQIFHLDSSAANTVLVSNLTNLGCLLDKTESAEKLRKIVIERYEDSSLGNAYEGINGTSFSCNHFIFFCLGVLQRFPQGLRKASLQSVYQFLAN